MSSFTRLPKGSTVLVTGATGLIGSATSDQLLQHGYEVVGVTRDVAKTTDLVAAFDAKYGKGHFRPVAIQDITSVDDFKTALKGVAGVLHIATDSSFGTDARTIIDGTVNATLAVLKAAAATPSVKAVVLTSSSITIWMPESGKRIDAALDKYDTAWTEKAYAAPDDDPQKAVYCYAASKVEGELAAWKFVRETKPSYTFNTVLPVVTFGRIVNPRPGTYSTATWLQDFFKTGGGTILAFTAIENWFVSVTDVARVHLSGLLDESVDGERLWAAAGPVPLNEVIAIWRKAFPEKKDKLPKDQDLPPPPSEVILDNSKSVELLKRQGRPGWDSLEDTVVANVADIVDQI